MTVLQRTGNFSNLSLTFSTNFVENFGSFIWSTDENMIFYTAQQKRSKTFSYFDDEEEVKVKRKN